jgi:aminoglycoside phosphotransferase (APT) family kinase protein
MSAVPGIDLGRLASTMAGPLDCDPGDLTVSILDGGRSNLTYCLSAGDRRWVLRRPPLGHVLATAHDMHREYRVLSALAGAGVRVPRPVWFEPDGDVIGAPFFIMDFVDGLVVRSDADAWQLSETDAAGAADDLADQLAALHDVDAGSVGLGGLGRPAGFLGRQLRRWQQQWQDSGGDRRDLPLSCLADELAAALPSTSRAAIVHGDYRLDNVILAREDTRRVAAIIDWEMSTLGDPLADVGLLLTYWSDVSAPVTGAGHPVSANRGFPSAAHLVGRYATAAAGVQADSLPWYVAFGHFKLAVIAQTIHARYLSGLTVGDRFDTAGTAVPALIDRGRELLADGRVA